MPKALHRKLLQQARKKGYKGERAQEYAYKVMATIEKKIKAKRKKKG